MKLDRVFSKHLAADRMEETDVIALFSPPPNFADCLEPVNQVLVGPKGSGKSIALRWLSFLPTRPTSNKPTFYGLVVPIGRYQFDYFRQDYDRTGDHRPFIGYLNFYLLDQILTDLQRPFWQGKPSFRLPSSYVSAIKGLNPNFAAGSLGLDELVLVRGLVADIQIAFRTNIEVGESAPGILSPICSVQNTISLLQEFADLISRSCEETRIGLLFDGLDHLGDLGQVLAPLLAKDEPHSERIITKAACRILPRYLHADSLVKLEEGRDYTIFCCGTYDDREQIETHLRRIAANRISLYADAGSTPPAIDSILLEATNLPSVGFRALAELAGGNVLMFLECCAFALRLEQEKNVGIEIGTISPRSQQKALKHQAEDYLMRDLNDQAGDLAPRVRKYLSGFAAAIKKESEARRGLSVSIDSSSFEQHEGAWQELKDTVSAACELRYMQVNPQLFNRVVRREEPFAAREVRLSNLQAPFFDLPLRINNPIAVTREDITSVNLGFGHRVKEQGLFPQGPYVFVSIPGNRWGLDVHQRIRKALRDIERWLGSPQTKSNLNTVTYREVGEKREGRYVDNLLDAIRGASYVVLDVTGGITSGVMVEIGIASGLRKPHALIWLGDKAFDSSHPLPFDPTLLPPEIKPTDIKIRQAESRKSERFYRWFHRFVHEQNSRLGEMCGFQGSARRCDCNTIARNPNKVYIRMQPRNSILKEKLIEDLQGKQITVVVAKEYEELISSQSCKQLREVGAAIFDVSRSQAGRPQGRYSAASDEVLPLLEVGYALGSNLNYSCVYLEDHGCINASMLGERVLSIPTEGFDRSVAQFVDYFVRSRLEQKQ